ncbi:MAG: type IV pilus assembly protein PilX [Gammaproteobacteria bacterium]|jgi:type IV pilus assembly protein PilX
MMKKQLGARHGTCQLHATGKRQHGSVLILSILFLTLITILAIGAARTSSVEALMGHGVRDLQAAFQAGESGLDAGENWLHDQVSQPAPEASGSSCTAPCDVWVLYGKGAFPDTETKDATWWAANGRLANNTLPGVSTQPRYLLEEQMFAPDSLTIGIGVPPGRTFYRVTTRGTGGTDAAEVLLQSSYVRRF